MPRRRQQGMEFEAFRIARGNKSLAIGHHTLGKGAAGGMERGTGRKWIWAALAAATLLFACLTFHDMQTSEGIGLYFAMRAGAQNRKIFDFLADGARMLCLWAAVFLPCFVSGRRRPDAFFRLLAAYLAFLPTVSAASLVHLADGTEKIALRAAVSAGEWGGALAEGLAVMAPALSAGVPLLLLAAGARKMWGESGVGAENAQREAGSGLGAAARGKAGSGLGAAACLLAVAGAVLFPALAELCAYALAYVLLLYGFGLWERLWDAEPELRTWGWILFGIFWLRGVYRMIEVMSVYHI